MEQVTGNGFQVTDGQPTNVPFNNQQQTDGSSDYWADDIDYMRIKEKGVYVVMLTEVEGVWPDSGDPTKIRLKMKFEIMDGHYFIYMHPLTEKVDWKIKKLIHALKVPQEAKDSIKHFNKACLWQHDYEYLAFAIDHMVSRCCVMTLKESEYYKRQGKNYLEWCDVSPITDKTKEAEIVEQFKAIREGIPF